jgi:hypothetical protein
MNNNNWRLGGTGLDGLGLGWATEWGSGALVPPMLIKDRSLHWIP